MGMKGNIFQLGRHVMNCKLESKAAVPYEMVIGAVVCFVMSKFKFTILKYEYRISMREFLIMFWSEMGCVRDGVPPQHFAKTIVEFQRTKGQVNIDTYNQIGHGVLWGGH